MTIRQYAKECGIPIVGKLTRRADWEYYFDYPTGMKVHSGCRHYVDEAGTEFIHTPKGICIAFPDGSIL